MDESRRPDSRGVGIGVVGICATLFSPQFQEWWKRRSGVTSSVQDLPPGSQRQASDLDTLRRIQTLLPSTESIQYLRDHDFGNAHRGAFLEPLDRFLEQTGGPEDQFLSSGLERLRQELRTAIATFQWILPK